MLDWGKRVGFLEDVSFEMNLRWWIDQILMEEVGDKGIPCRQNSKSRGIEG